MLWKKDQVSFPRLWTMAAFIPIMHLLNRDLFHWYILFLDSGVLLRRQHATDFAATWIVFSGSVLYLDKLLIAEALLQYGDL